MSQVASPSSPTLADAFADDDRNPAELLSRIRRGDPAAIEAIFDRYHPYLLRVLMSIMGSDSELADALQETYIRAMRNLSQVRDPDALATWLARVATFTARDFLRKRQRRRWLRFMPTESLDRGDGGPDESGREAMRRTHAVLDRLGNDERIAFSLRYLCELELTEVASHCDCSLATIKRRLTKAQAQFLRHARKDPVLRARIDRGQRWGDST
jgi:RNA polymerase sigma-70 factor, ECF subfamily